MKCNVYCDISNIYHGFQRKYGMTPNYLAIKNLISDIAIREYKATEIEFHAYGFLVGDRAKGYSFIYSLRKTGFKTHFMQTGRAAKRHKFDCDVQIAVDAVTRPTDLVALVSSDGDLSYVARHFKGLNKRVLVFGTEISHRFNGLADSYTLDAEQANGIRNS